MSKSAELSSTLEDYVRTMAQLAAEKGTARVRDLAAALSVHKSTVTGALKSLSEKGLVEYAPYEIATLTPRGEEVARRVARRHDVIRNFLVEVLSVDEELAEANACRMEHGLDREVLERLRVFAEFVKRCPHCGQERLKAFQHYYERESRRLGDESVVSHTQEEQ
ncbi:MAG: metal-dependent transcriptional regulator [bacterium]